MYNSFIQRNHSDCSIYSLFQFSFHRPNIVHINSQHLLELITIINLLWHRAFIPPSFETIISSGQKRFPVKDSSAFSPIMNKPTKIDVILSNFQHTSLFLIKPIICRYCKPKANNVHFPQAFYNLLHTLKFSFYYLLSCSGTTRLFYFKTKLLSFSPSFFFFFTYYQSTVFPLPSCFSDNTKTFNEIFKVVFF